MNTLEEGTYGVTSTSSWLAQKFKDMNDAQPKVGGIRVSPLFAPDFDPRPYSIAVRFSKDAYRCNEDIFTRIGNYVNRATGGVLVVSSTPQQFRSGIINFDVATESHAYNEAKIANAFSTLLATAFPEFKKSRGDLNCTR